ncbi:MAG: hypothetical protein ABGZ49_12210 [Akkermansiaceae bacterium]
MATFSKKFRPAYTAGQSKPEAVTKLEEMRENYPRSEEMAEIELTPGVIYGQRTGMVEPVKAGLHFTKALEGRRSGPGHSNPDAIEVEKEIACLFSDSRRATLIMLWCCQDKNERPWP